MATVKQLWARERNWNKRRLLAEAQTLRNIISDASTIPYEKGELQAALEILDKVLVIWKGRESASRSVFLKRWRKKYET